LHVGGYCAICPIVAGSCRQLPSLRSNGFWLSERHQLAGCRAKDDILRDCLRGRVAGRDQVAGLAGERLSPKRSRSFDNLDTTCRCRPRQRTSPPRSSHSGSGHSTCRLHYIPGGKCGLYAAVTHVQRRRSPSILLSARWTQFGPVCRRGTSLHGGIGCRRLLRPQFALCHWTRQDLSCVAGATAGVCPLLDGAPRGLGASQLLPRQHHGRGHGGSRRFGSQVP